MIFFVILVENNIFATTKLQHENAAHIALNLYNSHIKVRRMIMKSVSNFVQTLKNLIHVKMFKLSLHTNLCIQIKNPHLY